MAVHCDITVGCGHCHPNTAEHLKQISWKSARVKCKWMPVSILYHYARVSVKPQMLKNHVENMTDGALSLHIITFSFYLYTNFSTSAKHHSLFLWYFDIFFQISTQVFNFRFTICRWMEIHLLTPGVAKDETDLTHSTREGSETLLFSLVLTYFFKLIPLKRWAQKVYL